MRSSFLLWFFLAACGGVETSTVASRPDAEPADAVDSSNVDAGGCTGRPPILDCGYCGTVSPTTATCQGDRWMCPPPPAAVRGAPSTAAATRGSRAMV